MKAGGRVLAPWTGPGRGERLPADKGDHAARRSISPPGSRLSAPNRCWPAWRRRMCTTATRASCPWWLAARRPMATACWRRRQRCLLPTPAVRGEQGHGSAEFTRGDRGRRSRKIRSAPWSRWAAWFLPSSGRRLPAGEVGKTYTFAACVKALGGPAVVRLEVERAGRPWDRAVRGPDITISPGDWTELHLTFPVDKAYPEGWQAYLNGSGDGARFRGRSRAALRRPLRPEG